MSESDLLSRLPRSPELMSCDDTALLVVDVQEKLLPHISDHALLTWNIGRLMDGAKILGLPVLVTEQYPRGLGTTVEPLAERLGEGEGTEVPSKLTFSCGGCPQLFADLQTRGIHKILVVGIETHVCVQQTVFDLMTAGFHVYIAVDAIASRFEIDYQIAVQRMDSGGATITTTEAALFEWCDEAGTPQFKEISQLVQQTPPMLT